MNEEAKWAYFAGILDGEGSIGIYNPCGGSFSVRVQVVSTTPELIDWLQENIFRAGRYKIPGRAEHEQGLSWVVNYQNAVEYVLTKALPYLLIKKLNAQLAIKFCREYSDLELEVKQAYYTMFKDLNSRGRGSQAVKAEIRNLFASGDISLPTD